MDAFVERMRDEIHAHRGRNLACGHVDDDSPCWHMNGDGDQVCRACCDPCNSRLEDNPTEERES